MRFKRFLLWAAGAILVIALVAKLALLDTAADPGPAYAIDIEAMHRLATRGGPLPERIEVEKIGDFAFPRALVVAGGGFRMHPMVLLSHRVVWSDRSMIIDTAMDPKGASGIPGAKVDIAAFARMEKALTKAEKIVFTHEHPDHVGGIAVAPDFASIARNVVMTREQLDSPKLERKQFPPGTLDRLRPLAYDGLYTVAPGVVLQKAPGHTGGTQLIYVELASGARYLFVGDIAWTEDNIRLQRGRPPIAKLLMQEDRPAVAAQLQAIAGLPNDVHVVVAHDPVAFHRDVAAGLFKEGFGE